MSHVVRSEITREFVRPREDSPLAKRYSICTAGEPRIFIVAYHASLNDGDDARRELESTRLARLTLYQEDSDPIRARGDSDVHAHANRGLAIGRRNPFRGKREQIPPLS